MAVIISGKLIGPNGDPRPGVTIMLTAVRTSSTVVKLAPSSSTTGEDGSYSLSVEVGTHNVMIEAFGRPFEKVGQISVYEDSKPGSLNDFLSAPGENELTPAIIATVNEMRDSAKADADRAEAAAKRAEAVGDNEYTFKTVADGMNGTVAGQYFRVPGGPGDNVAFYYYLNDNGKAVQVSQLVGAVAVEQAIEMARQVDNRTAGLNSIFTRDGKWMVGDRRGRQSILVDSNGDKTLFGKTKAYLINVADRLLFGETAQLSAAGSGYKWGLMGSNFRVALGLRKDNRTVELHGIPLTTQRGALPNDVAVAGDSISQFGLAASQPNAKGKIYEPLVNAQCWAAWAMLFTGGRFRYAGTYATGGYTAAQILAKHIPRVIAAKPTFCIVLAGRNDVVKSLDFETVTRPALTKIYSKLRRAGIIPVVCTMSAQSGNTPGQDVLRYKINAFNRAYAAKYGLPFVDLHAATTDPLTGQWLPGYNQDASHPWPVAAKVMGKAVADAMNEWMAPTTPRKAISVTTPETSDNLLANPLFIDHTDGIPDGWVIDQSGTFSVADDPDVLGNAFVMSGRSGSIAMCHRTLPIIAGQRYGFGLEAKIAASLSSWVSCYVVAGSSTGDTAETVYLAGLRNWKESTEGYGYFYYEFTAPADVSEVTIVAKAQDGTLSIAQGGVLNITEI
ncbi:Prophage tail fibre N-terminal [Serratia ficaria]|uniref:prophage tail fiber N-terminal domain-containing protein n=1 Tax=Serratia ficaria TaxID=61651 RepID=UPI0021833884|nr:prophage tail fiber N-terminal domain-containing protein [Serratia ficaria]CAI1180102.1 Prophage tail fibre N-terminal [Serratia ficaria]CAI2496961.1 Prophage tail fibre N-terminal [Serratia ficaria]CAI2537659.1 Prophage tail fibre N-terminal [Serratia ficaria]CAI2784997.1 Prophage tail fibre N-terminal [Serratia ficaria]